jgi:glucose-1-phosphate adenylyltransferase
MRKIRTLAFVMAGGEGARLHPLTAERSKPAIPFGARYQIVDFVLSNLVNSGIRAIYLLVQYKSQSLIEHIRQGWVFSPVLPEEFVTVVPPQMRGTRQWFQGTADAVRQNLNLIEQHDPNLVAVFGADHIYRMDVRQMVRFHHERRADVSVAALPVPRDQACAYGVIATDQDGRVREFQEKPTNPAPMPGDHERALASMGNYLFKTDVLVVALQEAYEHGGSDFGHHVLPRLARSHRLFAYDFASNRVPGVRSYEEPAYWRDVGSIESYFAAHHDVLGIKPRFDVFNPKWPIHSRSYEGPATRIIGGQIENSILGAGTLVNGASVKNSVLRREVFVDEGAELEDCVVMDNVRIGRRACLRRAIVDRCNTLPPGTRIGFDLDQDRRRYHVCDSGIVVVRCGRSGPETRSFAE